MTCPHDTHRSHFGGCTLAVTDWILFLFRVRSGVLFAARAVQFGMASLPGVYRLTLLADVRSSPNSDVIAEGRNLSTARSLQR